MVNKEKFYLMCAVLDLGRFVSYDGWCLDKNGLDENDGFSTIPGSFTLNGCLNSCHQQMNGIVTGCEWHVNGKCVYHTRPLSGGSGNTDFTCSNLKGMFFLKPPYHDIQVIL